MEGGLFKKYELRILKNKNEKQDLLKYIEEKTGVNLDEKEITIEGKKIKIQTTSTKRSLLNSRGLHLVVKEKGYVLF